VHAAHDRSAMETLEALQLQLTTARSYIGRTRHRVGPSAIGCRDNPHGATYTPNPDDVRVCLPELDPRMRGHLGAAWSTGYVVNPAWNGAAVYPAHHVASDLARAAGAKLVSAESSNIAAVTTIAYRANGATCLGWRTSRRRRGP